MEKSQRHKWENDVMTDIPFSQTYKVDKCKNCGCMRLHQYIGKMFFAAYVIDGKEFEKLPKCKTLNN